MEHAKILIMTSAYNRPDFIRLQAKSFEKFMLDDYEFVVFNDAADSNFERQIQEVCDDTGTRCIRVPQAEVHKNYMEGIAYFGEAFNFLPGRPYRVNFREGAVIQFAFEKIGFDHNDIVVQIDSDIFLMRPLSIRTFMDDNAVYAYWWTVNGNRYPQPEMFMLNIPKLPNVRAMNFHSGFIGTQWVDLIGFSHFYMQCNPTLKKRTQQRDFVKYLARLTDQEILDKGYRPLDLKFIREYIELMNKHGISLQDDLTQIFDLCFLNYCHGSNWHGGNTAIYTELKTEWLRCYLEDAISTVNLDIK